MSTWDGGGPAAVLLEIVGARVTTVLTGSRPSTSGEGAVDTVGEPVVGGGFRAAASGIAGDVTGWPARSRCSTAGFAGLADRVADCRAGSCDGTAGAAGAIATRSTPWLPCCRVGG
ncbi:hypothetical protein [Actinophytocola sp.]|uniref:hypothetical protein n=1 Tax=Actinophytocola sp. TaxID=1872138 RepID=UPI002ED8BB54